LAGLGAATGLGILSGYEGRFINTLLPFFAVVALIAHALGWFAHRQWHRSLLGMIGPVLVALCDVAVLRSVVDRLPALHGPGLHGGCITLGPPRDSVSSAR
jgi:hypothetical protein